jgi:hypothetical protein
VVLRSYMLAPPDLNPLFLEKCVYQGGGCIHVGLDKRYDYDFFYRQNVMKPTLVGLAGPWASGRVEFNWPQHHQLRLSCRWIR